MKQLFHFKVKGNDRYLKKSWEKILIRIE